MPSKNVTITVKIEYDDPVTQQLYEVAARCSEKGVPARKFLGWFETGIKAVRRQPAVALDCLHKLLEILSSGFT